MAIKDLQSDRHGVRNSVQKLKARERSLSLDTCSLDYWPPLLDFGLLKSAKSLWGLLIDRRSFHAKIS
jgi:hypothetical protein